MVKKILLLSPLCLLFGMSACSFYKPLPLEARAQPDLQHIVVNPSQLRVPSLAAHKFDPGDGLDMTEVAMVAVANNPDLKVNRGDFSIARAQAFSAGLLPDPQLSLSRDSPTNGTDVTTAFSVGLTLDINSLLARSSVKKSAAADLQQADLNLLWQEWQVVAQARLLFVQHFQQQKLLAVLQQEQELLLRRHERMQQALLHGNVTLDNSSNDFASLQVLDNSINELMRQIIKNRYDLNALLGLAPDAQLTLIDDMQLPAFDEDAIRKNIVKLAEHRPDLLALKAGYQSQDSKYRQAIMAQFPVLSIGITRARDTSNIYTRGVGVSLSLPSFNHNRGVIAVEQATRKKLFDEYQARVNAANSEVISIIEDQKLLQIQLNEATASANSLTQAAQNAQKVFNAGSIDLVTYSNMRLAALAKQAEAITAQQLLLEQLIAMQSLIGGEYNIEHP